MSEDRIFQTVFCFGIEQIHNALVSSEGNTTGCWDHNALISNPLMRDPGLGWHQLADALGRHLTQTGLNRYSWSVVEPSHQIWQSEPPERSPAHDTVVHSLRPCPSIISLNDQWSQFSLFPWLVQSPFPMSVHKRLTHGWAGTDPDLIKPPWALYHLPPPPENTLGRKLARKHPQCNLEKVSTEQLRLLFFFNERTGNCLKLSHRGWSVDKSRFLNLSQHTFFKEVWKHRFLLAGLTSLWTHHTHYLQSRWRLSWAEWGSKGGRHFATITIMLFPEGRPTFYQLFAPALHRDNWRCPLFHLQNPSLPHPRPSAAAQELWRQPFKIQHQFSSQSINYSGCWSNILFEEQGCLRLLGWGDGDK